MAMWMDGLAARWSASWLAPLRRKLRISLAFLLCATGLSPAWASFTPPFEYAFSWGGNSEPRVAYLSNYGSQPQQACEAAL